MQILVEVHARHRNTPVAHVVYGHRYRLTATGEWWDLWNDAGACGYNSVWYMKRFEHRRRLPEADWFALAGFIAPAALEHRRETEPLGTPCFDLSPYVSGRPDWVAPATGVLHVFANDLTCLYWNNWGHIALQVVAVDSRMVGA